MSDDQDQVQMPNELETLKARADRMGLSYHPSIGVEKLREKVNAAMAADTPPEAPVQAPTPEVAPAPVETLAQERKRMKNHANELIRVRITCMNPAKKEWSGEIFTVGNALVGSITKYIPFNAEEGWHVPRIILEQLQARQCQVFTTLKSKHGVSVRQGKLIKEFAIEMLDQLTPAELHDLAQRQAMSGAID
jgi:hypothetical protein